MFGWFSNKKSSKTGRVVFTGNQTARWSLGNHKSDNNARAFAEEGYQQNVIVYQAINKTANAISAIPVYCVDASGNEVESSPLKSLIENPNPMQSGAEFMRSLVGFFNLAGNAYIERVMVRGEPRELYALRPDRMTVIPASTGLPSGYKYKVGQDSISWKSSPVSGESDIRHLKTFNPLDDWYGMSPVMAGAFGVDQHNEAMRFIQSLLQNGAAPSGVLQMSDGSLSDEEYNRLKAEIEDKYAGSRNAGRPMLLEGGLSWSQMGLSPVDLAIIETKYSAARDISLALGVPPLLLNIPGDSTYSNYKEARLAFYEETIMPLAQMIIDELNVWLSPKFNGVKLKLDFDQVPAIAEKRQELWAMADRATDLTVNERRAMKGYEQIEGGDQVLVQSSLVPLDFASEPLSLNDIQQSNKGPELLKNIAYGKDSFTPPKGVQEAAQQGLDYRSEYGRGGTEVGIARARDLSNGRNVSLETINRMVSFFARHEENAVPPSEKTEPDGGPTNGWIAWQLWGGNAGRAWSNTISNRENDE